MPSCTHPMKNFKSEIILKLYDDLDSAVMAWPLALRYVPTLTFSLLTLSAAVALFRLVPL